MAKALSTDLRRRVIETNAETTSLLPDMMRSDRKTL